MIDKKIVTELTEETNFLRYVTLLKRFAKDYLIVAAVSDTPCGSESFTPDVAVRLMNVGFTIPLHNKWRCSYAAIIDTGLLVFEGISQTHPVTCERDLNGTAVSVESICYGATDAMRGCKIKINDKNFVNKQRGLVFAVYDKAADCFLDLVRFDTYSPKITCYRPSGNLKHKAFRDKHPEVTFIAPSYPHFPESDLTLNEKFILENHIHYTTIKAKADSLKTAINEYIDSPDGIREVLSAPSAYIEIDGARRFHDYSGKYLNIVNGHRITTSQPQEAKRTIYIVGGCHILGIGVRDSGTLASQLQKILNEQAPECGFIVENYGHYLERTDIDNELTAIVETLPLNPGDIVIGYGGIATDISKYMKRRHNFGELFFDEQHHTENSHRLAAHAVFDTLKSHQYFEDTLNKSSSAEAATVPKNTNYGLDSNQLKLLEAYKSTLSSFYEQQFSGASIPPKIGAIVMNCNPFTLGHRYLIEQCAAKVDFLLVFVVQEDKSFFSFEDRISLVDKGTEDLPNVGVIESGSFIISTLTFSDYFNKSEMQDRVVDSSNDVTLFAREIAPAMHITIRFAGSEPYDRVTNQYNKTLAKILPRYGIEFEEIPRIEKDGQAISASHVRALLEQQDWASIEKIVPPTTFDYLQKHFI